jgi:hypothetical protein
MLQCNCMNVGVDGRLYVIAEGVYLVTWIFCRFPSRFQKWADAQMDLEEEGQELAKRTLFTLAFGER